LYIVCEHHLEKIERKKEKKDECEERRKKGKRSPSKQAHSNGSK